MDRSPVNEGGGGGEYGAEWDFLEGDCAVFFSEISIKSTPTGKMYIIGR